MAKSRLDEKDDYDSRREVFRQLHSLSPANRLIVLRHFCDQVSPADGADGVKPKRAMLHSVDMAYKSDDWDRRLTSEVYADLWILVTQYALDPVRLGVTLESWARRPWTIPPLRRRTGTARPSAPAAASPRLSPL